MKRLFLLLLFVCSPISLAVPVAQVEARQSSGCGADYYRNARGNCVHRPVRANRAPEGAMAGAATASTASAKVAEAHARTTAAWPSGCSATCFSAVSRRTFFYLGESI